VFLISLLWNLPAQAAEPIKIGFIQSLSGGIAQLTGIPDLNGVKIAIEEINNAGGILGRPLEIIVRDDKLNPEVAVREAKDLVLNQKVHWIQGVTSSHVALAVSAFAKESKVIFFACCPASARVTEEKGHRYVFRLITNSTCYVRSIAYGISKLWPDRKKVFILSPDYEYGHTCRREFVEFFPKLVPGGKIVGELWPKLGTKDFTPYIAKIMGSGCDVVYSSHWGGDIVSITKTAWPFGLFDKIKLAGENWGATEYLSAMYDMVEYPKGVLGGNVYPYWAIDNPLNNAFWPKFKKVTGMDASAASALGYSITYAFKAGIEKAGSLETEKIIDALEGFELDSVFGRVQIRKCDHQGTTPFRVGIIAKEPKPPSPRLSIQNLIWMPSGCLHSCSEVMAARQKE
jgi:branched-chain amino acid transport system substrate-binding protein